MTAASKMASSEADNECPACGHPVFQAEAFLAGLENHPENEIIYKQILASFFWKRHFATMYV